MLISHSKGRDLDQPVGKGGSHPLRLIWVVVAKVEALSGVGLGCFTGDGAGATGRPMEQSELGEEGRRDCAQEI